MSAARRFVSVAVSVVLTLSLLAPTSAWGLGSAAVVAQPGTSGSATTGTSAASGDGAFVPVTPARLADSRYGVGTPTRLAGRSSARIQVAGRGGVPFSGIGAVVVNLTVTNPAEAGYLTAWQGGSTPQPATSNVNFLPGQTVPNLAVVPVDADGTITIANGAPGATDFVVDITGFFRSGTSAGGFGGLTPARLADSRFGVGTPTTLSAQGRARIQVAGRGGAPASGISAVVVNLTATNPTDAGYLTAWAGGATPLPGTSNVNFLPGQTVPNLAVVPVNADGTITIAHGGPGTVDVVVDISGYFRSGTGPGSLGAVTPARLVDSRLGWGTPAALAGNSAARIQVAGRGGVPTSGISAVAVNLTVTNPAEAGYLTAWEGGLTPQPFTSNVNFVPGQTVPNLAVVPVNADGSITIANGGPGSTDFIVDVTAYFISPPSSPTLRWSPMRGVDAPFGAGSPTLSCVSWEFCVAVTDAGTARQWNGNSWSRAITVLASEPLVDISCPAKTFCMAISRSGRAFSFDGLRWSGPTLVAPAGELVMVSCWAPGSCIALDGTQNAHRFIQNSWTTSTVPHRDGVYPSSLSCPSASFCVLVDYDGKARTFDGSRWSGLTSALPVGGATTLTCPTVSTCVLIGGGYLNTYQSGGWTGAKQAPASGAGATCASLLYCVAFDEPRGTYAVYNGVTWTTPQPVDAAAGLPAPVTATACFELSGGFRCVGLSPWAVSYTMTNGKGWDSGVVVGRANLPMSVSCVSSRFCVAVNGRAGQALMYDGSSWSPSQIATNEGMPRLSQPTLVEVECATERFCVAIDTRDGASYSYAYNGSGWSGPAPVGGEVADLSCPTVNFCMAVATQTKAFRFDGTSWSVSSDQLPSQLSLSCTGPRFCLATSMSFSVAYDGSSWSQRAFVPGAERWLVFDGVACVSPTFCLGNDSRGWSAIYNGTGWSGVITGTEGMASVDCVSPQMCVATTRSEYFSRAAQFDGSRWTPTPIDENFRLLDISCPATNFCIAVNRTPDGLVARPR